MKGVVTDRIIGFDELGEDGSDDFPTESLERRLLRSGVLLAGNSGGGKTGDGSIFGRPAAAKNADSDDDNDW